MSYKIPLFDANLDEADAEAVAQTVRSRWISMGKNVQDLESEVAARMGVKHAVATSSCTSALHLALLAAGVRPGDEVILPSLTFVATANAVKYCGATPVFADILSLQEPTIDPNHVEHLITSRTRAIIGMHYAGFASCMDDLAGIAERHKIAFVQDAAHAIGTRIGDRHIATYSQFACFSFFANKVITSGEGGLVTTDNDQVASELRLLRSHGMTALSYDKARGHASDYDVVRLGYNYRIDDIRAALARSQYRKLDTILETRRKLRSRYVEALGDLDAVALPFLGSRDISSNYIFPIVLREATAETRAVIRKKLADNGIQTSVHYPPVHRFDIYRGHAVERSLPITEKFSDSMITLPFYDALTESQMLYVVESLRKALHRTV